MKEDPVADLKRDFQTLLDDFNPQDDLGMLNATQGVVDRLGDMQAAETRVAKENLKALLVARDAAKLAATRPSTIPTPEQRAETMEEYQQKRAAAMKASRMGDALLAKYQDHLRRLREEEIELEHSDVADEHVMDGTILKLEVAKQLGFEPIIDSDGNIVKLLIRSMSGEVHSVSLDDGTPEPDLTTKIWQLRAL